MNLEIAQRIYQQIQESQQEPTLALLYRELLQAAVRYAGIRAVWTLTDREGRTAMDQERTHSHNRFIDACNILNRNMAKSGLNTEWRKLLGKDRKAIGDFACYVHLFLGLGAR
jgi:hypothetical protein